MQIIWHGQSCFEIITAKGKGEHVSIIIDPLSEAKTGLKAPKTDASIALFTNSAYTDRNTSKTAEGAFIIDGPGEYEVKGIYIEGIASNVEKGKTGRPGTIYTIEAEDMKLCNLGNLQQAELTQEQIERIGNIDILMAPVGDGKDIGAKEALKSISQVEPSIAIPMNFKIPKLQLPAGNLDDFLKVAGVGAVEALPKLTIRKKEIQPEEAKIIVLAP